MELTFRVFGWAVAAALSILFMWEFALEVAAQRVDPLHPHAACMIRELKLWR